MRNTAPQLAVPPPGRGFGWVDLLVVVGLVGLLWTALRFGQGMLVHFDADAMPALDSSPTAIPYYAGRTMLRMWIAFGCSLVFAVAVGYLAAKYRTARALILPALDYNAKTRKVFVPGDEDSGTDPPPQTTPAP